LPNKNQTVTYLDAVPSSQVDNRNLAHEYHRHFIAAIPGFLFVAVITLVALAFAGWVKQSGIEFLSLPAIALLVYATIITVGYFRYTHHGFTALDYERYEKQMMADIRLDYAEWQRKQLTVSPLEIEQSPIEIDSFLAHFDEFAKRVAMLGDGSQARSQWLKADGARTDYQFSDGRAITRREYERIIKALEIKGRRKGTAGETE
jgi:hypothetical protein